MKQRKWLRCFQYAGRKVHGIVNRTNVMFADKPITSFENYARKAESYDEAYFESLSKSAEEPDDPRGLDMINLPWKRGAKPFESKSELNPRLIELEMAKQILEEVFHARPSEVEEMIQNRREEKTRREESRQEDEEMWPIEFPPG